MTLRTPAAAAALGLTVLAGQAEASVTIDIYQSGGNVLARGSGTLDLTDLDNEGPFDISPPGIIAGAATVFVGTGGETDGYDNAGISGPTSFGPGGMFFGSGSGETFGVTAVFSGFPLLIVPSGYSSGTALSSSLTVNNQTIASMGLTPGTYVYAWGAGVYADSLTVKIGTVPEPATWAMMALGFAGLGYAGYRGRSADAAAL